MIWQICKPFTGKFLTKCIYTSFSTLSKTVKSIPRQYLRVSLVGRPNTGKSTLFNRLANTAAQKAIVTDIPGTTRDRNTARGRIAGLDIIITDTGGLDDRGQIHIGIQKQVEISIRESDAIIFLVDAREGITSLDAQFASWIRKRLSDTQSNMNKVQLNGPNVDIKYKDREFTRRDVILVANKTEGAHLSDRVLDTVADALNMNLGDPLLISAQHGEGMADLATELISIAKRKGLDTDTSIYETKSDISLLKSTKIPLEERVIQLAIMGKPNVGKSSFVNAVLNEERVIVGPTPGLTRDSIHVEWIYNERNFRLVDTAGLHKIHTTRKLLKSPIERKKQKIQESVGRYDLTLPGVQLMNPNEDPSQFSAYISDLTMISALSALRFAQVVLLVVEGGQGRFSKIDLQIIRKCLKEGRAIVIAANKCDELELKGITPDQYKEGVRKHCQRYIREFGEVPIVVCSATQKRKMEEVMDTVIRTHDIWSKRYSTWVLNKWLKDILITIPMPRIGGRRINVKYITQVKTRPPTFAIFCNVPELPITFERFIKSRLQRDMDMNGIPIRFFIRKTKGNPTKKSLLFRSSHKKQSRYNNSERQVGPRRYINAYNKIKLLRQNRLQRRIRVKRRLRAWSRSQIRSRYYYKYPGRR